MTVTSADLASVPRRRPSVTMSPTAAGVDSSDSMGTLSTGFPFTVVMMGSSLREARGGCRLVVRDGVVRERQGDDDLVFQNFHVKFAPRVSHRFLSFTLGASSLVNSTPAYSRVRWIVCSVAGVPATADRTREAGLHQATHRRKCGLDWT